MSSIKYIPGEGSIHSSVVLVGDCPGAAEESEGRPFMGRSGVVLDSMLKYIGLNRTNVYITNAVKVRTPYNRTPTDEEIDTWRPTLLSELWFAKRKGIMVIGLGEVAAKALMNGRFINMRVNRGEHLTDHPLFSNLLITHHPTHLLRSPSKKQVVGEDLDQVKEFLYSRKGNK
jgi:DNA polymerase